METTSKPKPRRKPWHCLTNIQRLQLESLLKAKTHKKVIAKTLGVHLSTVYNEIKRGQYRHRDGNTWLSAPRYGADVGQRRYEAGKLNKGRPLKVGDDWEFVRHVERRILKDKLSPCAVLGEINRYGLFKTRIGKTTIYRYIETGVFLNIKMKDLPFGSRKKRYRKLVAKRAPRGTSIEQRPAEIAGRSSFGHWEMDCVCGSTRPALLVLTERLTRNEIIIPMQNQKADSVVTCLNRLERRFGKSRFRNVFKSITVDNGTEFSDVSGLEQDGRTKVFYCHPYRSSERGSNERLNREIRRLIPKGSDLGKYSTKEIKHVESWVNNYPREIFSYATSAERFAQELARL